MAEQTNSGTWTVIGIGVGVTIGLLIGYVVLKSQENKSVAVTSSTTSNDYSARDSSINREMFAEIQRLNGLIQTLSMENAELKLGLNISQNSVAANQETKVLNKLIRTLAMENAELKRRPGIYQNATATANQETKEPKVKEQVQATIEPRTITTYKNNEKLVYERGKDGRVKSINIIRDAKVNAG
jgi:hypothetical protein